MQLFKSPEELAKGYVSLEKRFGVDPARRIDLPADPNDKDGMRAVYARLGLPESPDKYGLALDDKATDADKAMLGDFTKAAHELGLPADMAKGVMGFWMAKVAEANAAAEAAQTAQASAGVEALKKAWGLAYEPKLKEIGRALSTYGDPELQKALEGDAIGRFPNLAQMLGKMLDRMAEPGGAGGLSGEAAGADRAMTPDQAKAELRKLESDPVKGKALRERDHPQHKAVVAERNRLHGFTNPA